MIFSLIIGLRSQLAFCVSKVLNYNIWANMHGYCNIIGSIQCYRLVDVRSFWAKMCKIHYFFYFPWTNVIALKLYPDQWVYNTIYIQKCYNNHTYLHSLDYLLYTPFYFNNKFLFFCYYYFHLVSFSSKISKEYYMAFSPLSLSQKNTLSSLTSTPLLLAHCCFFLFIGSCIFDGDLMICVDLMSLHSILLRLKRR